MSTITRQMLTHEAKRGIMLFRLILDDARRSKHNENGARQWIVVI